MSHIRLAEFLRDLVRGRRSERSLISRLDPRVRAILADQGLLVLGKPSSSPPPVGPVAGPDLVPGTAGQFLAVGSDLKIRSATPPKAVPDPAQGNPGDRLEIGVGRSGYALVEPPVPPGLVTDPLVFSNGVSIRTNDGPPVSFDEIVEGTHAGDIERGGLLVDTDGPTAWFNDGTLDVPVWLATTIVSDAGPPAEDLSEAYGTIYQDTTAYGIDPATGWWRNAGDETVPEWYEITDVIAEDLNGATPTDGIDASYAERGSIVIDTDTPGFYQNHGTYDEPDWRALVPEES